MKYNELTTQRKTSRKRVGRGISAGGGKTAGRGTKGQKSRTGKGRRPGFEGGQTPLMMRLPKLRGFRTIRPKADVIYTGQLDSLGAVVTNQSLVDAGLVAHAHSKVKLLSRGDVTKKHTVKLQHISEKALAQVQKAGGSFELIEQQRRVKSATKAKNNK